MGAIDLNASIQTLDASELVDATRFGGKTAGLARLIQRGIRVPPGWVIPCSIFSQLCEETGEDWGKGALLRDGTVSEISDFERRFRNHCRDSSVVHAIAQDLAARCETEGFSTLAIRSSFSQEDGSAQAFAGVFQSVLEVSPRELPNALVECWASTFLPEAINYLRQAPQTDSPAAMAIVVQNMVHGRLSGVAFSRDPIDADPDVAVIEYVEGDCAHLVDGTVTPRRVKLHRHYRPNSPELLPEGAVVLEVMQTLLDLEALHPTGCDIEWTFRDNELHILQCRPITTQASPDRYAFSARNATSLWASDAIFNRYFEQNTVYCAAEDQVFLVENNYFERYIGAADQKGLRDRGHKLLDDAYFEEVAREIVASNEDTSRLFSKLDAANYRDFSSRELIDLLAEISQVMNRSLDSFKMSSAQTTDVLFQILVSIVGERDASELAMYTDVDPIDEEAAASFDVDPQDPESCRSHLNRFPWLASNCATLDEAVSVVVQRCNDDGGRADSGSSKNAKSAIRARQNELLRSHSLNDAQLGLVKKLQRIGLSRFQTKTGTAGVEYYAIGLLHEIGRRYAVDVETLHRGYFLKDLLELVRSGKRLSEEELQQNAGPLLVHVCENDYRVTAEPDAVEQFKREHVTPTLKGVGNTLKGHAACKGSVRGRAVCLRANDQKRLAVVRDAVSEDCILVCDMLQPSASDLIRKVGGVVTDEGGVLSHAAILAREFDVPCVVGVGIATKLIEDGEIITVFGDVGEVIREREGDSS